MKIVIASPFYPPDTEDTAVYTKKLSERLVLLHDVTVVAYSRLPEETNGVKIFFVNKRWPLFFRLIAFTIVLFRVVRKADILYVENGASVELPVGVVAMLTRCPFFIHIGDTRAKTRVLENFFLKKIRRFVKNRSVCEITDIPFHCPEILPFGLPPTEEQAKYEDSWEDHIKKLTEIFNHKK